MLFFSIAGPDGGFGYTGATGLPGRRGGDGFSGVAGATGRPGRTGATGATGVRGQSKICVPDKKKLNSTNFCIYIFNIIENSANVILPNFCQKSTECRCKFSDVWEYV